MDTFASDTDRIAAELIKGGMDQETAMRAALRLSQSRQQANGSILGGIPTQPAMSDIPPVEEPILGGDPSRLFRREPTVKDRIKSLPQDVIGAGEALMSLGSAAALTPASMLYALRPGQKAQGAPFEFATRNMYLPRTESGIRHLEGLGEVLEQLPQTGPLPELQAFAGMTKGMGTQAAQKAREARAALAPAVAQGAEDLLRRQGLVMDLTVYHGSPYKFAPTKKNPLGEFNPEKIGAGEGAQAYGYGHYLSEAPRVAQSYADVLASPRNRVMDKQGVYIVPSPMGSGKYMLAVKSEVGQPIGLAEDATQLIYTDKEFPNLASAIKFARQKGLLSQDERQKLTAIGEDRKYIPVTKASDVSEPEYTQFIASNPGYFYTVDIPDEMIGRMLDWDKPLGQQSETIQRLAKQVGLAMDDFGGDLVARFNANRPEGAMLLREQGIPGIRYYDQASRPSDITSRKLVDLYNKYGDIDKAVDEMMRTVHNTPKEKQKIREQFVEKLQTGLTRNFVVFPGEEDLLNIIERNKDGGSIDRKKIEDAAKEIAKKYAKGGAAMMAGGGKVISIGAKAARTAKASKEAKIEKPVITEPAPSLATVDFADKNWRSAIDDLVSYMNNIGVPYAPWKFMRNEPDIPLNRVMNEIERDVSFVQSLPSFPKGQVDILQDLFKKARDAESSYSRSGTQRDPLTGEPLMSGGGGLAKTVQAGAKAAKTAAAEASKMRAQAGKKVGDIIAEIEPEKFSEALGKQNIEGTGIVKVTQADRTRVGGPSNNIGGSMFSALQLYDPFYKQAGATWGVGKKSTAQALINQSTPETLWTTLLGSEDQLKSNPIVFDQLFKAFNKGVKDGRLTPELRNKINTKLEPLFGEGADILDPKIRQLADTFEKRALLADLLLGKQIGGELRGGSIIPGTEILKRETEPLLLHPAHGGDVPTFSVGPRLFQLSGEVMNRPDLHPGFPVILGGKDLGVTYKPVPGEIAMLDYVQRMKKERGRVPGYYEWTMGEKGRGLPSQLVTDEYLTYLQKEGFKSGGLVGSKKSGKTKKIPQAKGGLAAIKRK